MAVEGEIGANRGIPEPEDGEIVGEFISQRDWDEVGPIMAAIRQSESLFKTWIKEAILELISECEIKVHEEDK